VVVEDSPTCGVLFEERVTARWLSGLLATRPSLARCLDQWRLDRRDTDVGHVTSNLRVGYLSLRYGAFPAVLG
jgi:hypothetical protein